MTLNKLSMTGTILTPNYYEGPEDVHGDVYLRQRLFSYEIDAGRVTGKNFNVMFTIDRLAQDVWPYFKDFNLWQNVHHHYYSGVLGDLEGRSFRITVGSDPNDPRRPSAEYNVVRVIPEHMLVVSEVVSKERSVAGFSPDCHVFMLIERDEKTIVTGLMEHAALSKDTTEEQALDRWRTIALDSQYKWRDIFIPTLKKLIQDAQS